MKVGDVVVLAGIVDVPKMVVESLSVASMWFNSEEKRPCASVVWFTEGKLRRELIPCNILEVIQ